MSVLNRGQIPEMQQQDVREAAPEQHTDMRQMQTQKANADGTPGGSPAQNENLVDQNQQAAARHDTRARQPQAPVIKDKLPGRNDPCPCGSGKKFKNCHGKGLV